ncbi:hypothetical protein AArcS_0227 [Natranaeroarchaeum sulfidigenes]|uniref:Uncharacterized protein n=1 Tax=Natranaeroarchaeum sulfidigenes TaxID=2784880 RepID=A0A897MM53_9EURY|nr:hypothetical protein AArcS_0227 [Natranaeroarchaeum sulfidigenes]
MESATKGIQARICYLFERTFIYHSLMNSAVAVFRSTGTVASMSASSSLHLEQTRIVYYNSRGAGFTDDTPNKLSQPPFATPARSFTDDER